MVGLTSDERIAERDTVGSGSLDLRTLVLGGGRRGER
jgi:hypothetical protein